jgi:hypothetical protein
MTAKTLVDVYRIDIGEHACRSVEALVRLNMLEVQGVQGVTSGRDGTLLVVSDTEADLYDDVVLAAVRSGIAPGAISVVAVEPLVDTRPLTLVEAERLGLIAPPKEPVRASKHTIQRVSVEVTDGYDPETVIVEAGVPVEIEFSEGHGCLGKVVFDDLGVEADLEDGGAIVVIPALEPGTYAFRCGRDIVHGSLIAE